MTQNKKNPQTIIFSAKDNKFLKSQIRVLGPFDSSGTLVEAHHKFLLLHYSHFNSSALNLRKESSILLQLDHLQSLTFSGTLQPLSIKDKHYQRLELKETAQNKQMLASLQAYLRKNDHITICKQYDIEDSQKKTGFEDLSFIPQAIPELDLIEIDSSAHLLGQRFSSPILITAMTGGTEHGKKINENLAYAASKFNIPMGVGSQRIALENKEYESIFKLKNKFPKIFLMANLGFSDLIKASNPSDYCKKAINMIEADALAIHINSLQECLQSEGNTSFKGFWKTLEKIKKNITTPIIIKEVGCGMDCNAAKTLYNLGIDTIDIGGRGGTSWPYIEFLRQKKHPSQILDHVFRDWGIPTAYSLAAIKSAVPKVKIIATGGIRDGITLAKACAMGASICGVGLPLFKAALISQEEVLDTLCNLDRQLKITMLATKSLKICNLKKSLCLGIPYKKEFENYIRDLNDT